MKCPKCNTEMEDGFLNTYGYMWKKGKLDQFAKNIGKILSRSEYVIAYRCPQCKLVELHTE